MGRSLVCAAALLLWAAPATGQVFRQTFEGAAPPPGWVLEGRGAWDKAGPSARRVLTVTGTGDDMSVWRHSVPAIRPGAAYRFAFTARVRPGSAASTVTAGLDACNRDFGVSEEWKTYSFVAVAPNAGHRAVAHLGQWHLKGTVEFADVTITEVDTVHTHAGALVLGEGEHVERAAYHFAAPLGGEGSNGARPRASHTAAFNSNRWVFGSGQEVVYRHTVANRTIQAATVTVAVNYHVEGACIVEAATDGRTWKRLARLTGTGRSDLVLPGAILPARAVWVRLASDPGSPAAFQVDTYSITAQLSAAQGNARAVFGRSHYLAARRTAGKATVTVRDLGGGGAPERVVVDLAARPGVRGQATTTVTVTQGGAAPAIYTNRQRLVPGRTVRQEVPYRTARSGRASLSIRTVLDTGRKPTVVYAAQTAFQVADIHASGYGHPLATTAGGVWWWCEGTYKVGALRRPPVGVEAATRGSGGGIRLEGAGRERLSAQLVLHGSARPGTWRVSATDLVGPGGRKIGSGAVRFREVQYVTVKAPTDAIGVADEWPDPLPPLVNPWRPRAGRNSPLWLTVTVPAGTPRGTYAGWVVLRGPTSLRVPLRVTVWSFSLPPHTALRSGFGLLPGNISRYHNVTGEALSRQWDLYMRSFAERRVNPYNPMALAPIGMRVVQSEEGPNLEMDFSAFGREARRYLDGLGFNAFVIGFQGLGHGRHPNYDHGSFMGYADGTPEYDRLMTQYGATLQGYLETNGWLERAYVYWYDEPEEKDYPFVVRGMGKLTKYAPRLKRMLTEEFQPPLFGHVQLWCPITPAYDAAGAARRRALGEEVWWYVCTGPKEPWVGLFIDHPATEMRVWLWQTWKHRLQGILIWETLWWTSPKQFPDNAVQDPWTDPMGYVADATGVWGNGDGRFYYPPNRHPNSDRQTPFVVEPIPSLRWEMLAEGIQDWDCLHLLEGLLARARDAGVTGLPVKRGAALLRVPDSIVRDMTHFTVDPQPIYAHRRAVGRAIEALQAALAQKGR